jgi:hypothetical protein
VRRARTSLALALALAAVALPGAAAAESPRYGTFELRLGGYRPDIDSEFAVATPYADVFGKRRGLFPKALVSWTFLDAFVKLDAGLGTGWFRATGKGRYESPAGSGNWVKSGDTTSFTIIPVTAALTARLDGFKERWNVPLELYGRAALERYHWLVGDAAHGVAAKKGATNGWSVAGGVGFLLDFVDPALAREFDADAGVNATWIYLEVERSTVDDFGSSRSWNLSDRRLTLSGGLRMVF